MKISIWQQVWNSFQKPPTMQEETCYINNYTKISKNIKQFYQIIHQNFIRGTVWNIFTTNAIYVIFNRGKILEKLAKSDRTIL